MKEGRLPCGYVAGGLEKARGATPAEGETTAKRTSAAPGGWGGSACPGWARQEALLWRHAQQDVERQFLKGQTGVDWVGPMAGEGMEKEPREVQKSALGEGVGCVKLSLI